MTGRKILLTLAACGVIYGAFFSTLRVFQYRSFFSLEWEDEAAESQVVYNIAHHFSPVQTVFGDGIRPFSDHFTPIDYLIAPFYRLAPHILTWYFLVNFLFGMCVIPLFLIARDVLKNTASALAIAFAYLLYPALHFVSLGIFDPRTMALPPLLLAFYFMREKKFAAYFTCIAIACLAKEDTPLIAAAMGIYLWCRRYPKKWWASTFAFSTLYFALVVYAARVYCRIPGSSARPEMGIYSYLDGPAVEGLIELLVSRPSEAFHFIFEWSKLRVLALLFAPLLFLPLLSWEILIPATMFAEILLGRPGFFNQNSDYLAPIIPFVFIALIFSLAKLEARFGHKVARLLALAIVATCLLGNFSRTFPGQSGLERSYLRGEHARGYDTRFMNVTSIFDKRLYTLDNQDHKIWRLIAMIPKDAVVMATGDVFPALCSRRHLHQFRLDDKKHLRLDFILINKKCLGNGLGGRYDCYAAPDIEAEVARLVAAGEFSVMVRDGDLILMKKMDPKT